MLFSSHRRRPRRRLAVAAVTALAASSLSLATAQAAPPPPAPAAGSSDAAWGLHLNAFGSSEGLPVPLRDGVRAAADGLANLIAPGEIARRTTPPPPPAPAPAPAPTFDPSRCPRWARVCLDLDREITWLQRDGKVTYGPVRESAGAPYPATATPRGRFTVIRKVEHEVSHAFNEAPMPYSVYFTNSGMAFHQGSLDLWSHGCVHLTRKDAKYYFDNLNIGDPVAIF